MADSVTIPKKQPTNDVLDYSFLKEEGIKQIQQLAGKRWTDYNLHDPGITILEILSYALTELGYRSQYSVKDLLTESALAKKNKARDMLYEPSEILSAQPLTVQDYKKMLLDIDGVKNADVSPSARYNDFRGIYDVDIELFPDYTDPLSQNIIKQEIMLMLNMNRNLCEDFNEPGFFSYDPVTFLIDIEISGNLDTSHLLTTVYSEIVNYLSPTINFYGLYELLEKGYEVNRIFDGPFLKNGFIIDNELNLLTPRTALYTSDIIHFLMDIEGISFVKYIRIIDSANEAHEWICKIQKGKAPQLNIENSRIRFFNLGKEIDVSQTAFDTNKIFKRESRRSRHKRLDFIHEPGIFRNLLKYYSIQNDFPETFGIGDSGLPPSASAQRKAQARQLKGYLLFFEQMLANYFAQLSNLKRLFSLEPIERTYFTQVLFDLPGIQYLYMPFINQCIEQNIDLHNEQRITQEWKRYRVEQKADFQKLLEDISESDDTFRKRRNRVLDHLLARFALNINTYHFFRPYDVERERKYLQTKIELLKEQVQFSKERGKAFNNIFADMRSDTNISGLEFRLNMLLGIKANSKKYPLESLDDLFTLQKAGEATTDATSKDNFYELSFEENNVNEGLRNIFRNAVNPENYTILQEDGHYRIRLIDSNSETVGYFKKTFDTGESAAAMVQQLAEKFLFLSEQLESIHLIEHILLRPTDAMPYFGFEILDHNGKAIFRSLDFTTFAKREERIQKIFHLGIDTSNYQLIEEGINQHKIAIAENGTSLIKSIQFYSGADNTTGVIKELSGYFSRLYSNNIPYKQAVRFFTKYEQVNDLLTEPYSFTISVLLPNWTPRFQDERFKRHVTNVIQIEMPAHILPAIKWCNWTEMNQCLQLYNGYLNEKHRRLSDIEKLTKISDELLALLI